MFYIKNNILYFIIFNALVQIQSLVELPAGEDKEIVTTELAVRTTVNRIFSILNLTRVQNKARFTEFATIHNFFVTITLQDHENLKEIASLTRVDNIDNNTQYFITQINEVLNEDNKSYEATDDVYVTTHIETFIRKLEYLKYRYGFTNNAASFGINPEVLKHLKTRDNLDNVTKAIQEKKDVNSNILSDIEFWQPSGRRVFEGSRTKIKWFPFMASVHFFKKFQCAGSIIKSDLVITSASCLQLAWNNRFFRENPAFLSVQVGCDLYEGGDENIPIMEVYFHPEYDPKNLRNNLAIMRLLRVLKFGKRQKKIKKIDFDREPWPLSETTDGITIVGWGAKSSDNIIKNIWSNRLAYAELDFYPLKECQDVYSKEFVTYKNFCAGFISKGGGACNRDVGGPGVAHGILVGVVSFGSPNCGTPDAPTVFTKLGYYTDWIEGILEMKLQTARVRTTERPTRPTYNINHYISNTKPTFKITPIASETEPIAVEVETHTLAPEPIRSLDAIRALNENKLFKEFITTMFGSEEVKDYLDQYEYDADKSDGEKSKSATAGKDITRANVKLSTKPTKKARKEVRSVKMVTRIEKFERSESSSVESNTAPSVIVGYTYLDANKEEDERKVEENISKLIDDIDIQELLASDSSGTSDHERVKPKAGKTQKVESKRVVKAERLIKSEETDESSNDDDDDEDDAVQSDDPLLSLLDLTKNDMKHKQRKMDEGLSIPAESFKDFKFRQNNTSSGILDLISQNDLMKLLTKAVADVAKNKHYKLLKT